jgi:hypothetical protein
MDIGMLWFDDSSTALQDKVSQAVSFYQDKFGETPTHCLVHPQTLKEEAEGIVAGVQVRTARNVMPNHYWIGVDEKSARIRKPSLRPTVDEIAQDKAA